MKASDFAYERPDSVEKALELLTNRQKEVHVLAGGQSLMPMMNFRLAQPDILVDLNGIEELDFIEASGAHVEIGAMTRYATLEASENVKRHLPLISMAMPQIAHPAIRNRGTIGGSAALADPAAEIPAILIALGAAIIVISSTNQRQIPADDFFLGTYETALDEGELIKAISIPKAQASSQYGFYELARRHGDYAMAGIAIAADAINPFAGVRIAMFGVSSRVLRVSEAENALNGANSDDHSAIRKAMDAVSDIEFEDDLNASQEMKKHLAQVVLRRALEGMSK